MRIVVVYETSAAKLLARRVSLFCDRIGSPSR
jgi:hypothetical protein